MLAEGRVVENSCSGQRLLQRAQRKGVPTEFPEKITTNDIIILFPCMCSMFDVYCDG